MFECLKEGEDVLLVLSHHAHNDLRTFLEDALFFEDSERVHNVCGEPKGNYLWDLEFGSFFKNAVKVYVSNLTSVLVNQNVVAVTIT